MIHLGNFLSNILCFLLPLHHVCFLLIKFLFCVYWIPWVCSQCLSYFLCFSPIYNFFKVLNILNLYATIKKSFITLCDTSFEVINFPSLLLQISLCVSVFNYNSSFIIACLFVCLYKTLIMFFCYLEYLCFPVR